MRHISSWTEWYTQGVSNCGAAVSNGVSSAGRRALPYLFLARRCAKPVYPLARRNAHIPLVWTKLGIDPRILWAPSSWMKQMMQIRNGDARQLKAISRNWWPRVFVKHDALVNVWPQKQREHRDEKVPTLTHQDASNSLKRASHSHGCVHSQDLQGPLYDPTTNNHTQHRIAQDSTPTQ